MPTILEWLGGEIPRGCDGASLLPLVAAGPPADWRDALHYEYDFRDVFYSKPEGDLGLGMDESSLCVIQDAQVQIRPLRRAAAAVLRPGTRPAASSPTWPKARPMPGW